MATLDNTRFGPQNGHAHDVTAPSEQIKPLGQTTSRLSQMAKWLKRTDLAPKIELALAVLTIIAGLTAYYYIFHPFDPLDASDQAQTRQPVSVTLMVGILLVPILGLSAMIARRLYFMLVDRRRRIAGSQLHGRFVLIFCSVAVVPTLLIGVFASLFFESGWQVWFSERIRTVLDNAGTVAEGYVREHRKIIEADLRFMANDLNRNAFLFQQNPEALQQAVFRQAAIRSLNEAVIFDADMTVLARTSYNMEKGAGGLSRTDLQRAASGDLVVIDDVTPDTDRVGALLKLENFYQTFLYVSRRVDPTVMASYINSSGALSEYQELEQQREAAQIRFNFMLISVAIALLLASVMLGIWFASRLTAPIGQLVLATEKVRLGDLAARVPLTRSVDEIGALSRAFNRMTSQLQNQRDRLISTNQELDDRRTFIEAVLEGVSAGVIGLTPSGKIDAINRSAIDLLRLGRDRQIITRQLSDIAPKLDDLRRSLLDSGSSTTESQVDITFDDTLRSFDVKISTERGEGDGVTGFVLTFDDVTEKLSFQRRAAWADVARRIAHEIKNPLTPIQLSAERLKRKYRDEITSDLAVFEQCTDTIIRQVGDLRQMVDEFSSFARMPKPNFTLEDLKDVLRQAVFLQEVGESQISFSLNAPETPVVLPFDRRLIAQAITNILKNAMESIEARLLLGPDAEKAPPWVKIDLSETDEHVTIQIRDNGRGLPVAQRATLVEPYVTTRAKGTGLGLAIVKKIMEDHGADISLDDDSSGGAQVTLTFSRKTLAKRFKHTASQTADTATGAATKQQIGTA